MQTYAHSGARQHVRLLQQVVPGREVCVCACVSVSVVVVVCVCGGGGVIHRMMASGASIRSEIHLKPPSLLVIDVSASTLVSMVGSIVAGACEKRRCGVVEEKALEERR
jgi:hypothetical protein